MRRARGLCERGYWLR